MQSSTETKAPAPPAEASPLLPSANLKSLAVGVAATALAGCRTADTTDATTNTQIVSGTFTYPIAKTDAEASRFLLQAQFSASDADIAAVKASGYVGWLENQIAQPISTAGWDLLDSKGYSDPLALKADGVTYATYFLSSALTDQMVWTQLMTAPDAPRKRMALALSEILVVSILGVQGHWKSQMLAAYWDVLNAHAFGNYRNLLGDITLNPAMGYYLNTKGNKKADGRGSAPDENYARELMQLFTIGLVDLNMDGTPRLVNGQPVETYTNDDVSNLAHVFTGWDIDLTGNTVTQVPNVGGSFSSVNNVAFSRKPMVQVGNNHSAVVPTFLGFTLSNTAAVPQLDAALDILFNHANTAPFVCKQLIQRLVTSNPTPAYVQRVASVFVNNGRGVRGDMGAVYAAILLDDEARSPDGLSAPTFGKVREPMVRLVQLVRTFGATSTSGNWTIGNLNDPATALGQSPLESPSVFNFFRPGYVPAATSISAGKVVPEFQIVNESSVAGYLNFMQNVIGTDTSSKDIKTNPYTNEVGLALSPTSANPTALIDRLNLLLCGGQLSSGTVDFIATTIGSMKGVEASSVNTARNLRRRAAAAIFMVMASAEYIVQK